MSSTIQKPTILLIPGAWHPPTCFRHVIAELNRLSYPTTTVDHPSGGISDSPKGLYDDIANIRSTLDRLVNHEGKDVVLVIHSYGGIPASASIDGFEKASRKGRLGGIIHMVWLAAFIVPTGGSLRSAVGGTYPDWHIPEGAFTIAAHPEVHFYNDLSTSDAKPHIAALTPHSTRATEDATPSDCFNGIVPCTYLICTRDKAIPPYAQELMAKTIGENCEIERCESGHSPYLSKPDIVLKLVRRAAGEGL